MGYRFRVICTGVIAVQPGAYPKVLAHKVSTPRAHPRYTLFMPTTKPRVGWIIDPTLLDKLKELSDKSGRTVPKEAEQAIKNWLQLHGKLPVD